MQGQNLETHNIVVEIEDRAVARATSRSPLAREGRLRNAIPGRPPGIRALGGTVLRPAMSGLDGPLSGNTYLSAPDVEGLA